MSWNEISATKLAAIIAEALRSDRHFCLSTVEENGAALRVTFNRGQRFAVEVRLDPEDFDDCA